MNFLWLDLYKFKFLEISCLLNLQMIINLLHCFHFLLSSWHCNCKVLLLVIQYSYCVLLSEKVNGGPRCVCMQWTCGPRTRIARFCYTYKPTVDMQKTVLYNLWNYNTKENFLELSIAHLPIILKCQFEKKKKNYSILKKYK